MASKCLSYFSKVFIFYSLLPYRWLTSDLRAAIVAAATYYVSTDDATAVVTAASCLTIAATFINRQVEWVFQEKCFKFK